MKVLWVWRPELQGWLRVPSVMVQRLAPNTWNRRGEGGGPTAGAATKEGWWRWTKMVAASSHEQDAWSLEKWGGVRQSDVRRNGMEHDSFIGPERLWQGGERVTDGGVWMLQFWSGKAGRGGGTTSFWWGGMKVVARCFVSTSIERGRVVNGGARCNDPPGRRRWHRATGGGGWLPVGPIRPTGLRVLGRWGNFQGKNEKKPCLVPLGQNRRWATEIVFRFWNKVLGSEIKGFKYFQIKFELESNLINWNKFFGYFSNLELLKIILNFQIQTKTLNEGLLKWFKKDFKMKFESFQKVKPT
jgi:hypothetical protein